MHFALFRIQKKNRMTLLLRWVVFGANNHITDHWLISTMSAAGGGSGSGGSGSGGGGGGGGGGGADLSQFRLARTLQQQAQGERAIEVARELLTDEPTYSAFDAFKILDPHSKGFITADDLKEFLRRFGVYAN